MRIMDWAEELAPPEATTSARAIIGMEARFMALINLYQKACRAGKNLELSSLREVIHGQLAAESKAAINQAAQPRITARIYTARA